MDEACHFKYPESPFNSLWQNGKASNLQIGGLVMRLTSRSLLPDSDV
jgi:hypothetical protein